ncbi:hypothetical protein [Flavobacterium sp.]|uniref:hypothetical protein n=1 Tax=Flavobacterium sp. TaxID=239 RepID=UPI00333E8657
MKRTILLLLTLFLFSCGVKQTQSMLSNGDYDGAIERALDGLRTNKNAKGNQDYVYLLEEAFAKAKERDLNNLSLLIKEKNPSNFEKIYNLYIQLHTRQDKIRGVLPLKLLKENRNALFPFSDYSNELVASKADLSTYLYDNSKKQLSSKNKLILRQTYDDLVYLDKLNPDYKNVRELIDIAKFKGTDFVFVSSKNETNMVIPARLQDDLLDFSTYGINDKWTEYHNKKQNDISYDFALVVNFREIKISPEQVREKQFIKEKQIKDGTKPLLDSNGIQVKDSEGKPMVVDVMKTITANIYEFTQFKSVQTTAKVEFHDLNTNQLIDAYPLTSEFVFNYIYANYNGDKSACEQDYFQYFDRRAVPFPTNEQMVYDSGEDIKAKLKAIITGNRFRR